MTKPKKAKATSTKKARVKKAAPKATPRVAQPWELQPGETAQQFVGFVAYRDLLPQDRSIDKAYEVATGRKLPRGERAPGYFGRWSSKNGWPERAAAWDGHVDEQRRRWREEAEKEEVQEMARRQIGLATALQTLGANVLNVLRTSPEKISPHAMIRAIVEGSKLERLNRGEPETIVDLRDGGGSAGHDEDPALRALLEDPEALEMAQELALKLNAARGR
ncbi:MAG TPA: hypothetical protein VD838_08005 [Anaeromyxobacteraceae bacterium]|nr:hypothetical protein [Anaeromyxobacteraceae bacterium]